MNFAFRLFQIPQPCASHKEVAISISIRHEGRTDKCIERDTRFQLLVCVLAILPSLLGLHLDLYRRSRLNKVRGLASCAIPAAVTSTLKPVDYWTYLQWSLVFWSSCMGM